MSYRRWYTALSLFAALLLAFSFLLPTRSAQAAPRHSLIPLTTTCYGDLTPCDGTKPPPISNCANVQSVVEGPFALFQGAGATIVGHISLYYSNANGCNSLWGAVQAASGQCITINALGMWESGGDGSNQGALDSEPVMKCNGTWESTYMVGHITGNCYWVAIVYDQGNQGGSGDFPNPHWCQ